jgi:hypothetical protein
MSINQNNLTASELTHERWAVIAGHEDYEVSDLGRVRRRTPSRGNNTTYPGRIRKLAYLADARHVQVRLYNPDVQVMVSGLVAHAFIGRQPEGTMVLHRDLDWRNCRAVNLVYAVNADLRLTQATISVAGQTRSRGRAKLLPPTVLLIRRLRAAGQTQKAIADLLHLPWRQVGKVIRGEIYGHVAQVEAA